MAKTNYQTTDDYIEAQPEEVQEVLKGIRHAVHEAAPEAKEVISYQMPTFRQNGILVHFGAHNRHIGFYPTPSAIKAFEEELAEYESAKGSVKFPLNKPMPIELIKEMVRFRVRENLEKNEEG